MNRGKIIIVEGTSCVGKTTLCSNLEKNGWVVIPEAIRYLEKETHKKVMKLHLYQINKQKKNIIKINYLELNFKK